MKKLTRLKLINWHRFSDVTIDLGDSTLISGENGAGKSTLLDAIQFVVTCSANNFNKAAHENGKRKLTGYIRCKTGREHQPYERTGELSAHIALEFYEESRNKYFIVGAVIDSATEGQETVARYLMDNSMLSEEMFKNGKRPRTITEFRTFNNKKIKTFAKTNAEAKRMMKQRFGRIEDKFFQLIPKAMAFKPIDDIKDFVYSYVLDEKEVNIDTLRENVRSYQELEKTLEGVKRRIEKLKEIEQHHLEQAKTKLENLNIQNKEQQKREGSIKDTMELLDSEADVDVKYRLSILPELKRTTIAVEKCQGEIRQLEEHSSVIQKQIRVKELQDECKKIQTQVSKRDREIGSCETNIKNAKSAVTDAAADKTAKQGLVAELAAKAGEAVLNWKHDYDKQTTDKTYEQFRFNFDRRRKANRTNQENADKRMQSAMVDYKTAFDFGAAASYEAYAEYASVQDRLVTSELLTYEDKVTKARISAEEEFREQFLSKLQENMKQAQGEFKNLNKALRDITFSNERYEFLYLPSKRYGKYYEMIMDDFNVVQGESIFSGVFHENHKEVIDELFSRLALDQDNSAKTLDEFTDYRTYMDYDIKILHGDGNYSLYSKVCEEKSGGETQTPFYVTVAASFVQLYSNNIGGEAIGLVMFDEAFNNMDDERIGGVLEFLNRLPLQMIIAAPPDKIQYIGPKMEETLLVLTDEKLSFVEEYHYDAAGKKDTE